MQLQQPVTITPPPIGPPGRQRTFPPVTFDVLNYAVVDLPSRRQAVANIPPCRRPLVLWEGEAYDAAGDWTQADVEARLATLLGENPAAVLESLFLPPPRPLPPGQLA